MSAWRQESRRVLSAVNRTLPKDADLKTVKKAYSAAYPFGTRSNLPYQIWLSEVRGFIAVRFPDVERARQKAQLQRELDKRYKK